MRSYWFRQFSFSFSEPAVPTQLVGGGISGSSPPPGQGKLENKQVCMYVCMWFRKFSFLFGESVVPTQLVGASYIGKQSPPGQRKLENKKVDVF